MKCATCGSWSWVRETRTDIRVRECANEHRWRTQEVLVDWLKPDLQPRNAAIRADQRPARVIAAAYGLSVKTVWTIKREQ